MASRDNEEIFDVPSAEVPARTEQSESRPQRSASRMVNLAVMVWLFVGCCLLAAGCMLAAGAHLVVGRRAGLWKDPKDMAPHHEEDT